MHARAEKIRMEMGGEEKVLRMHAAGTRTIRGHLVFRLEYTKVVFEGC